jgi:hypothetical protein
LREEEEEEEEEEEDEEDEVFGKDEGGAREAGRRGVS